MFPKVIEFLRERGYNIVETHPGRQRGPDIVAEKSGTELVIEMKGDTKALEVDLGTAIWQLMRYMKDESHRRKSYSILDKNPILPFVQFNPILEWTNEDVWEYIHTYGLPYHPLYDMGFDRIGCWCCPYKTNEEWKLLEKLFPEKVAFLEQILEERARKMKVADRRKFVKEHGWTAWISPIRRISVGKIESCQNNKMAQLDVNYIEFDGRKKTQIEKVSRLLPVLTDLFWVTDNSKIKVIIDKAKRKKLKILVEKAINCVSCGACTSLCPKGALKVDDVSVYVDNSTCTRCGACTNGSARLLRGACIVRNYASRPATLIDLRVQ